MSDERLIVNVEEQLAKRLYDRGFTALARKAVLASKSLPDNTPAHALEASRLVPLTKQEQADRKKAAVDATWENLRSDRDGLLKTSDWTQLADVPVEKRTPWAKYRQQLRDLPDKTKDPAKVDWPKPPV